jgi:hypothetical protein
MSHAFFLVMGGFVWEDEHSIFHPITVEDLYGQRTAEHFAAPIAIETDGLRIPLYNSPSLGAQTRVINSTLLGCTPDRLAVPQVGADSANAIPLINRSNENNKSTIPLIDLIAHISEADIVDKSAGDGLSKSIAMVQVVWFVAQLIGRTAAQITITELEVITAGYAVMNLGIYILWWSKPLLVNQQIVLYSRVQDATRLYAPNIAHRNRRSTGELLRGTRALIFGRLYRPVDKVGLLWAGSRSESGISGPVLSPVFMMLALVFGLIHAAAWNSHFLSLPEMWLWRSTSAAITLMPSLSIYIPLFGALLPKWTRGGHIGVYCMYNVIPPLYIICRIVLLVLPLIQLRALPPDAFLVVPWSTFIPHI